MLTSPTPVPYAHAVSPCGRTAAIYAALAFAILLLVLPERSHAATYTIKVNRDTWVEQANPSGSHGGDTRLEVNNTANNIKKAYLNFDMLGIVPKSQEIVSVKLKVYVVDGSVNGPTVRKVRQSWPTPMSWKNRTTCQPSNKYLGEFGSPASGTFRTIDISDIAKSPAKVGICLLQQNQNLFTIASREATQSDRRPAIIVTTASRTKISTSRGGLTSDGAQMTVRGENGTSFEVWPNETTASVGGGDTYIQSNQGTANYGTATALNVQGGQPQAYAYLKFNPSISVTGRAILNVYVTHVNSSTTGTCDKGLRAHNLSNSGWSEASTLWSKPHPRLLDVTDAAQDATAGQWTTLDITKAINGSANGNMSLGLSTLCPQQIRIASGEYGTASLRPFITLQSESLADTSPPSIYNVSPAVGSTASGTVTVSWSVSDTGGSGFGETGLDVDGVQQYRSTSTGSHSFAWNTVGDANGAHQLVIKATDNAANVQTYYLLLMVSNVEECLGCDTDGDGTVPSISTWTPAAGSLFAWGPTPIDFTAAPSDGFAVAMVEYLRSTQPGGTTYQVACIGLFDPFECSDDPYEASNFSVAIGATSSYNVRPRVTDASGEVLTGGARSISIQRS